MYIKNTLIDVKIDKNEFGPYFTRCAFKEEVILPIHDIMATVLDDFNQIKDEIKQLKDEIKQLKDMVVYMPGGVEYQKAERKFYDEANRQAKCSKPE